MPQEVLEAHKDLTAQRALNQILATKPVRIFSPAILRTGTQIYGYAKLQKGQGEWRPFSVIMCDGQKVEVRRAKREPEVLLALEDVRLAPQNLLAKQLMEREIGLTPSED